MTIHDRGAVSRDYLVMYGHATFSDITGLLRLEEGVRKMESILSLTELNNDIMTS
jgi:hypothetical protein